MPGLFGGLINFLILDGFIGKVERKDAGVFIRLCHKETFFNKRKKEWETSDDWFTVYFFGKKADAAERDIQVGDRVILEAGLVCHPKTGPESRIRINGISFHILLPKSQEASPTNSGNDDYEP